MNDENIHHHMVPLHAIERLASALPRRAKTEARTRSCVAGESHDAFWRTVNRRSKARASEEASAPSVPRAMTSGSNRITLRASFHSDRSQQSSAKSGDYTRRQRHSDHDVVTLRGLKH